MMMTLSSIHTLEQNKNTTMIVTCRCRRLRRLCHHHRRLLLLHRLPHRVQYRMTLCLMIHRRIITDDATTSSTYFGQHT